MPIFKKKSKKIEKSDEKKEQKEYYEPEYGQICKKARSLHEIWDSITKEVESGKLNQEEMVPVFKRAASECDYSAKQYCDFLQTVKDIPSCGR